MNEIINHTKGEYIYKHGAVASNPTITDTETDLLLVVVKDPIGSIGQLAPLIKTAPHSCSDPKCPGNINRQKLEMFDEMASFIENECIDFDVCSYDDCKTCRAHGSCSTEIAMNILSRARALQEAVK